MILGIAGFISFYFLLKMKKIGWTAVNVLGIASLILIIIQFSMGQIPGMAIWIIILAYLWKKRNIFE